eukprot:1704964-Rhodomonas_salina.1
MHPLGTRSAHIALAEEDVCPRRDSPEPLDLHPPRSHNVRVASAQSRTLHMRATQSVVERSPTSM